MGKQLSGTKRGFNRPSKLNGPDRKKLKFQRTNNKKFNRSPSPSTTSDGVSEEEDEEDAGFDGEVESEEEQVVYREPTVYENLLKKLGSGNDSIADAARRRRKEEEGKSDTEEDEDEELLSSHSSESEEEGSDSESSRSPDVRMDSKRSQLDVLGEPSESDEIDSEEEKPSDNMHRTVGSSNFVKHLGHSLSQGDIDELIKTKWTYKWKSPAIDIPNCKWRGTGDLSLKVIIYAHFSFCIMFFCSEV
ncbi:hypothetical protein LIER_40992 [Lithospermum erythrorhizon]|uniref:Uncharacterized protein n=1 Tax=Lithospermum erythrorhizon TaxID=34254 RepID=A0AAV3R8K4_LITER